ncbi:zf-HC2 domain-containing protein [Nonomuraea turcica]|uniref:zf-HC2 domain-containing protein n=1 Tax=Nonomuraea sp. G32 TaxID=3067274 RepID=UPI00273AA265|nr:zf-HC2 domain-containing protein [Nonomuraea sp. G32]MDP4505486.1 zf-HC2 domain-containing protein [Nonomuraea sp. G32]
MTERPECEGIREAIPELAAGALAGDERADVLRHLSGCAACRRELEQATQVVDALTTLAPAEEPPAAFESAVLARISGGRPRHRWRPIGMHLLTAAIVAALVGGGVWGATGPDRRLAESYRETLAIADGRYLTAAVLYAGQRRVGHAFAYQGSPSWIFLTVEAAGDSGSYQATLAGRDGAWSDLGQVTVSSGRASWGTTVPTPIAEIDRVVLRKAGSPDVIAVFAR